MPSYVVKAAKGEDLYLIWSTVVDSATAVGTRDEIRDHLWREYRRGHPDCTPAPGSDPDARMTRADIYGSSTIDPPLYRWDDEAFLVMEDVPAPPPVGLHWQLPRTSLAAYTRALIADDDTAAHALLQLVDEWGEEARADG